MVLRGSAKFVVGEDEFDAPAGAAVFLPRPDVPRGATALVDGTVVLAVGGWPDRAYHSLPWEPIYLAQESMRRGDWAAAADTLEREAGDIATRRSCSSGWPVAMLGWASTTSR